MRAGIIRVRKSTAPVKGGMFTAGGDVYTVQSDPRADDAERFVWVMTVT
jgi:hypothetical protein